MTTDLGSSHGSATSTSTNRKSSLSNLIPIDLLDKQVIYLPWEIKCSIPIENNSLVVF